MMKPYKKIYSKEFEEEDFGIKEYMKRLNYEDAVKWFKIREKLVKTIKRFPLKMISNLPKNYGAVGIGPVGWIFPSIF